MSINERLKELRAKRGLNQSEMADILDVSLSSYQKYEREKGSVTPSLDVLTRISDYYNVSVDYLLGRDNGEPSPLDQLASTVNMSELEREIIDGYFKLDSETRGLFMDMLETAVKNVQDGNSDDIYRVAMSDSHHPGEIRKLTKEEKERFDSADPVTSDTEDF